MSRFTRFLKTSAKVVGVLLIVALIANAALVWYTTRQLEDRLTALRAAGAPVVLTDLDRPAPPAEKDAATFLDRAQADVKAVTKELVKFQEKDEYREHRLSADDLKSVKATFD